MKKQYIFNFMTLAILFFATTQKMQSQTTGLGKQDTYVDIYNATGAENNDNFVKHLKTANFVFSQDVRTRVWNVVGIVVDNNFDVNQPVNPPTNNDPILYPNALSTTTTNFRGFLRDNLQPGNSHEAWLALGQNFSDYEGYALQPSQGYSATATSIYALEYTNYFETHEQGHVWQQTSQHNYGTPVWVGQSMDDNGTPFDPTDDDYLDNIVERKTLMSGLSSTVYIPVATVSSQYSTGYTDANGEKWVVFTNQDGIIFHAKVADIDNNLNGNAQPNVLDKTYEFFTAVRPDRLQTDNNPGSPGFPTTAPTVSVDTGNSTFALNFVANDTLSGTHPILKDANGNTLASIPDTYELYIYNSSNTADGAQLNPLASIEYFQHGENIDYTAYGSDPANLSYRIYNVSKDQLSPAYPLIVPDTTPPVANTQPYTASLDTDGTAELSFSDIDNGSYDDSGNYSVVAFSPTSVDCSNIGSLSVSYTLEDPSGNQTSGTETVNVVDNTAPNLTTQNVAGFIDANGEYTVNVADFITSENDNCGIASESLSQTNFSCSDVGLNSLIITVTDNSGNSNTYAVQLTLQDTIVPTVVTQDVAGFVDADGEYTANVADFIASENDNCGIASESLSQTNFSCSDLGAHTVQITVQDIHGNSTTESATLTLSDNLNPEIPANLAVVGETSASISLNWSAASDNCSVSKYKIYRNGSYRATINAPTTSFTDTGLNPETTYNYTIKSVDGSNNESALSGSVSGTTEVATDTEAPTAPTVAVSNVTDTSFTLTSEGSTDNVGVTSTEVYLDETIDGMPNGSLVYTSTASQPVTYEFTGLDANTTYETYTRTTDVAGNASAFSNVAEVQTTVGIEDQEIDDLKVYPNPANEQLTISIDGQLDDIEIYNLQGQLIKEFDPQGANKFNINVRGFSEGMYFVKIKDKDKNTNFKKLILK